MYTPKFNSVLVEIDDQDAKWGSGNDESMLGKSYHKGKFIKLGKLIETADHPRLPALVDLDMAGQDIIWNEGAEAGTTFEHDGKLYGFIYWFDIRGQKIEQQTSQSS